MYETTEENDGYKAMKFYTAKLNPKKDAFFQCPKTQWKYVEEVWYDARPIGVNKLDNMIKSIRTWTENNKSYGLESIKYEAVKFWNSLSDSMRTTTSP